MFKILFTCMSVLALGLGAAHAQTVDSLAGKALSFPSRLFGRIQSKTAALNDQLTSQTQRYLKKMARQEARLQQQLSRKDSNAAKTLFAGTAQQYAALSHQIATDTGARGRSFSGVYPAYLDSLQGSVAFLNKNPQLLSAPGTSISPRLQSQLQGAGGQLQALQGKLQDADQAKAYMQQRKQQIAQYIAQHSNLQGLLGKSLTGMNKNTYYFSQQLSQYKEMWNNPDQLAQKALVVLNRLPAFQTFMKSNSMLGGLFNLPGSYASPQVPGGLQTRSQVGQLVQGQISAGGADAASTLQSSLQSAESQLDGYKAKLSKLGTGNGDMDMPNFVPNDQKTKSLWKCLEYSFNFQTTHNSFYYPSLLTLGLGLGYKLGHSNVIGVGASYEMGTGNGINHIAITGNGLGLRSFVTIKIKSSFSLYGGFEYNYTTPFTSYQQLKQLQYWTRSGLIGVQKTVSMKSNVLKKTTLAVLWDFLSYQQVPQTQPLIFRIGYNF